MAEQLSLFGSPEPEQAPATPEPAVAPAKSEPVPEPIAAYASVVLDIPTRALSEPFAYGIPRSLANEAQIGSTVLVHFGNRAAAGYIVDIALELGELQGNNALDPSRIKPIEVILSKPLFTAEAARIARWMSREYVATLSECLRLFLPPGGSPRVVKGDDGMWTVERPAVKPIQNRWVMLTPEGFDYTPPKTAVRQRQLIEALQCGPVTTRDLNLLYNSMSAAIKALEKRGVVVVEERRAWRGCSEQTTLSSASGKAPVALTNGQQQALAQIERARLDAHGDVVLVDGVTGSGKTEVYLSAIERVLAAGRSACVLVPEISLTAQTVGRFRSRFGETVAVFHSRLSAGERLDQWDMVASGAARVVVGARSALFCPLSDLGLIIIDEEHETSYKQGSSPRYHAPLVAADAVCLSCGAHPAKPNVASTPAAAAPVMNERRDTPVSLIPITASSNDGFTCSMRRRGTSRETTLRTQTGARTPPEAGNCETPLEVGCSTWGYGRGIVKANFRMSLL